MQGQAKFFCESSASARPLSKPKLSLQAVAKSMWSCPSRCSEASHAWDALQGDHQNDALALRKKTLAGILAFKERVMANKKPLPGIVIGPLNVKVIPPCEDCHFIGYDNLNDLIAADQQAAAAFNPEQNVSGSAVAGDHSSVPLSDAETDENFADYHEVLKDCCKGCFGDSFAIPFDDAACTSKGEENNNKTEAGGEPDHAGKMDSSSTSKL